MPRILKPSSSLLALFLVAAGVSVASAHCCHDDRSVALVEQAQFRPGLHGLDNGITDQSLQADPPSIGRGLGQRGEGGFQGGGLGQMHGNSLGAYGAGSIGEMGPGGLGALRGYNIGVQPPRPR